MVHCHYGDTGRRARRCRSAQTHSQQWAVGSGQWLGGGGLSRGSSGKVRSPCSALAVPASAQWGVWAMRLPGQAVTRPENLVKCTHKQGGMVPVEARGVSGSRENERMGVGDRRMD